MTRRDGTELLCLMDGPHCSLPSIDIHPRERLAEQINAAVRDRWNLEAYSLATCLGDSRADSSSSQFQVMECVWPDGQAPPMACWIPLSSLAESSFRDPGSFLEIQGALREIETHPAGKSPGPFASPGWMRELRAWIQEQIGPLNLRLTGQFRQLTASPAFSLIRFETTGPALWFKAVGEPNVHELGIVSALATLFPLFLPRVIASRPDWNAWLMTAAEGTSPDSGSDPVVWKTVSARLAQLQILSVRETDRLLAVGCHDLRAESLLDRVDDFFASMNELMKQQTKTPPAILTFGELQALGHRLKRALSMLAATGIPDVLNHLDINPTNIIVSDGYCTFLDWAEAAIGHPFLTLEYLLEHFKRLCPESSARQTDISSSFAETWEQHVSRLALSRSLSLAPLAAVFACAVSDGCWRDSARLANPQTAAYFRSLTRRMRREADVLQSRILK